MLKTLKFIQGAVARKDFVASLTHFLIKDHRVTGSNGSVTLSSPINLDLNLKPKAAPFVKAIEMCDETVAITATSAQKVSIKAGAFQAFVDCTTEEFPDYQPEGQYMELKTGFVGKLKNLAPVMSTDASKPWAMGVLFRGQSMFATNNVIVAESWLGFGFPVEVNLPSFAVRELLRIKQDPIGIQVGDNSVTFHYEGGMWLRASINPPDWPDVSRILDQPSTQWAVPPEFFTALDYVKPFLAEDGYLYLQGGAIRTSRTEGEGATVTVPGLTAEACFSFAQLDVLKGIVTTIDLTAYPAPCLFFGDGVRGAVMGVHA